MKNTLFHFLEKHGIKEEQYYKIIDIVDDIILNHKTYDDILNAALYESEHLNSKEAFLLGIGIAIIIEQIICAENPLEYVYVSKMVSKSIQKQREERK